jgi:hypothetical protein
MSDFGWEYTDQSNDWMQVSEGLWGLSDTVSDLGDQLWLQDQTYDALLDYQTSEQLEWLSNEAYDVSWEAYYGPVNSEGYTAYDAAQGYTTSDTSLIEPASSAGSMSMISDYNASSTL